MKVEYSSNNSGGSWWLKDSDWIALEAAGWVVEWGGSYFCHSRLSFIKKPDGAPEPCASESDCHGHRRFDTAAAAKAAKDGAWLGALARKATIDVPTPADAVRSFEKATGQDASDEGCNCCGAPHSFSWDGGYASGDNVVALLHGDDTPKTLREAVEALKAARR